MFCNRFSKLRFVVHFFSSQRSVVNNVVCREEMAFICVMCSDLSLHHKMSPKQGSRFRILGVLVWRNSFANVVEKLK